MNLAPLCVCAALLGIGLAPNNAGADGDASNSVVHGLRAEPLSEAAPPFTVVDMNGGRFSLADQIGHPIVLHFWATWCKPCRTELPALAAAQRELADRDVRFIAISIDRDAPEQAIRDAVRKYDLPFTVALAKSGNVSARYWSWGIPVTYLIDRDGRLRARFRGSRNWGSAEALQVLTHFADG